MMDFIDTVLTPLTWCVSGILRFWHYVFGLVFGADSGITWALSIAGLVVAMVRGPVGVAVRPYHLAYTIKPGHGLIVITLYVVACCGTLLVSGYRHVVVFGVVNLVAVAVIAKLTVDGFASVWCGWAAVTSGVVALHMRLGRPHRALPYVLT